MVGAYGGCRDDLHRGALEKLAVTTCSGADNQRIGIGNHLAGDGVARLVNDLAGGLKGALNVGYISVYNDFHGAKIHFSGE